MNARLPFYALKKLFVPGLFLSLVFHCMTCGTNTLAGEWQREPVEQKIVVNRYTSIAVDKNGKPYICYSDISNHRLTYAYPINGSWTPKDIFYTGIYSNTIGASIAVDTKNKLYRRRL